LIEVDAVVIDRLADHLDGTGSRVDNQATELLDTNIIRDDRAFVVAAGTSQDDISAS
jgi:hypothetical protein